MQSGHWALPAGLGHQKARPGLDRPKSPRAARGPAGLLRPLDLRYHNEATISRRSLTGAAFICYRAPLIAAIQRGVYLSRLSVCGVRFRKNFIRLVISRDILHNNTSAVRPTAWTRTDPVLPTSRTGRTTSVPSSTHHGLDGLS
jgi:hypothetical protein